MNTIDLHDPEQILTLFASKVLTIHSTADKRNRMDDTEVVRQLEHLQNKIVIRYEPDTNLLFVSTKWVREAGLCEHFTKLRATTRYITTNQKRMEKGTGIPCYQPTTVYVFDLLKANAIRLSTKEEGERLKRLAREEFDRDRRDFIMQVRQQMANIDAAKITYKGRGLTPSEQDMVEHCMVLLNEAKEHYDLVENMLLKMRFPRGKSPLPRKRDQSRLQKAERKRCIAIDVLAMQRKSMFAVDIDKYVVKDGLPVHVKKKNEPTSINECAGLYREYSRTDASGNMRLLYIRAGNINPETYRALGIERMEEIDSYDYKNDPRYRGSKGITICGVRCTCYEFDMNVTSNPMAGSHGG